MFRLSVALLAAVMTFAPLAEASAQSRGRDRDRDENSQQDRRSDRERPQRSERPRVSPDEARRRAEASSDGRRLDVRVRPDGNYGVLMESGGRVREVVVDGQTGQVQRPHP